MQNYSKIKKWLIAIAIFMGTGFAAVVSPVVHTLSLEFPDVPMTTIRSITTIPSLISFFCGLIFASVIGKKISYRATLVLGLILCTVGGVMPVFLNANFTMIIFSRVVYGFGFAVFAMRNAIITKAFGVEEGAKWMGYGGFVGSAANVLLGIISGNLGDINWRYSFALHAIALVALAIIIALFIEPKAEPVAAVETKKSVSEKKFVAPNPMLALYFLIILAGTLCLYPFFSSISTFIADRGLGSATEAGWTTSAYTAGGAILGIFFGAVNKKMERWVMPLSCLICIVGYVSILFASNVFFAILGGCLCGAGFSWFSLTGVQWASNCSNDANRALSMTIISSAISGGSFVSTYFITLCKKIGAYIPLFETEIEKTFLIGVIIFAVIFVITMIRDLNPKVLLKK